MLKRIITAAVALAVFIVVLLLPPIAFTIALAAVIMLMLYECYTATKADIAMKVVGFISAALLMAGSSIVFTHVLSSNGKTIGLGVVVIVILIYMALVIKEHGKRNYKDVLSSGFLTLYVVISMGCVWYTKMNYGTSFMLLTFICAWSCDTFAYFSGRFFGRHKLIPHVSPKKTVEGSIGGIIGAGVACGIYVLILNKCAPSGLVTYPFAITYGIIGGALSQIGDLTASAIKRDEDIKDFGWIFPGHGGFMDRFDSVMYIAPILQILLIISFIAGQPYTFGFMGM